MMAKKNDSQKALILIGKKLAALRIQKGCAHITEFTRKYKLPQIQYWRIERGRANITMKSLVKILAIHKLSLTDFFKEL